MTKIHSLFLRLKTEVGRWYVHVWRFVRGFPYKKSVAVSESLFVGGQFRSKQLPHLVNWGITGVISMRTHYPKCLDTQKLIEFLNLPTKDRQAPTIQQLEHGVSFIQKHIDNKGKVYIHCQMGEGRGPTMAAAYFISQGMTIKDAIETITRIRPFLKITSVQRQQLQAFASKQHLFEVI